MENKEVIKNILKKWQFPILEDEGNHIVFRYQMQYIQASFSGHDEIKAIAMTMSSIFTADDEEELFKAMRACNELNNELLHVKLYIGRESELILASEFFYRKEDDVEFQFKTGLDSLILAKKRFIKRYEDIDTEAALLAELEDNEDE